MKKNYAYLLIILVATCLGIALWKAYQRVPITLKTASFQDLPGWHKAHIKKSFQAFQLSCKTFLRQNPERPVGSQQIHMQVKDWQPACTAAVALNSPTEQEARDFFQKWFSPVEFHQYQPVKGLFTGYYLPLLHGSRSQSKEYNIPIYGLPDDLIGLDLSGFNKNLSHQHLVGRIENNKFLPYYTRAEIDKGILKKHAPVLVWVNSPIDRLFLEIQGSGIVALEDGSQLYLGYAGENGAPYKPVGKVLIDQGVMTKDTASMQRIKAYLEAHPQEIPRVLNQNKSFVFFRFLNQTAAMGAQGVVLTPGYSLAVDRKWIPLGMPLWLDTTHPTSKHQKTLQRLMIAQDTGGAIRGTVRGDVFWGAGDKATFIAGNMKNEGHYWLLLPRHCLASLPKQFS